MNRNSIATLCAVLLAVCFHPWAPAQGRVELTFPDILGYQTLKVDFHTHTVFSDGLVWPTVRVDEVWREGLDGLSITDHIEYKPHKEDVSTDDNRPFEIAAPRAAMTGTILFRGAEITRSTPPGHYNAVFLHDVKPLIQDEFLDAVKAANEQKAFVFWNHPLWKGPELGDWREVQQTMYDNHWLHGIEVANGDSYYAAAHQWCLDKGLTMLGDSDIHQPSLNETTTEENHRTLTLVFAKERSIEGIKEAAFAGRTAAWAGERLVARPKYLQAIFEACVKIGPPHYRTKSSVYTEVRNSAPMALTLVRVGKTGPATIELPAQKTTMLEIATKTPEEQQVLAYRVQNFLAAPEEGLLVEFTVPGK